MKLSVHEEILQDSIQVHNFVKMLPVVYQCFWLFGQKTIGGSLDENAWKSISRRRLISCGKVNAEKNCGENVIQRKFLRLNFKWPNWIAANIYRIIPLQTASPPEYSPQISKSISPKGKFHAEGTPPRENSPPFASKDSRRLVGKGQMSAPNPLDIHRQTELLWTSLGPSLAHKEINRNKQYSEK